MKNKHFIENYKKLPRAKKERSVKRDLIIEKCGITQTIFYNWYSGITEVPERFVMVIDDILETDIKEIKEVGNETTTRTQ